MKIFFSPRRKVVVGLVVFCLLVGGVALGFNYKKIISNASTLDDFAYIMCAMDSQKLPEYTTKIPQILKDPDFPYGGADLPITNGRFNTTAWPALKNKGSEVVAQKIPRPKTMLDDDLPEYGSPEVNAQIEKSVAVIDKWKKDQQTIASNDFQIDWDTYAKSWDSYPIENGGATEGQRLRNYYKSITPQILQEIKNIYGEPFTTNKVVVVYDYNLEGSSLNESGAVEAPGRYIPNLDLVIYSNTRIDLNTIVHEITHAFNHGGLSVDSYEEGMVTSVANIVTQKINNSGKGRIPFTLQPTPLYDINTDRSILPNVFGIIRTINDGELIGSRYLSAANYFYSQYAGGNGRAPASTFYKDYRKRLSEYPRFPGMLKDSQVELEKMIRDAGCNAVAHDNDYFEIYHFLDDMENTLLPGLSKKSVTDVSREYGNTEIKVNPPNELVAEIDYENWSNQIKLYSTYKVSDLMDATAALYQTTKYGSQKNEDIHLENQLAPFLKSYEIKNLQEIAYLLERPLILPNDNKNSNKAPDTAYLRLSFLAPGNNLGVVGPRNNYTEQIYSSQVNGISLGNYSLSDILNKLKLKNDFTGSVNIDLNVRKKIYKGKIIDDTICDTFCFGITKPKWLRSEGEDTIATGFSNLYLLNGKVVSKTEYDAATVTIPPKKALPEVKNLKISVEQGGGSVYGTDPYWTLNAVWEGNQDNLYYSYKVDGEKNWSSWSESKTFRRQIDKNSAALVHSIIVQARNAGNDLSPEVSAKTNVATTTITTTTPIATAANPPLVINLTKRFTNSNTVLWASWSGNQDGLLYRWHLNKMPYGDWQNATSFSTPGANANMTITVQAKNSKGELSPEVSDMAAVVATPTTVAPTTTAPSDSKINFEVISRNAANFGRDSITGATFTLKDGDTGKVIATQTASANSDRVVFKGAPKQSYTVEARKDNLFGKFNGKIFEEVADSSGATKSYLVFLTSTNTNANNSKQVAVAPTTTTTKPPVNTPPTITLTKSMNRSISWFFKVRYKLNAVWQGKDKEDGANLLYRYKTDGDPWGAWSPQKSVLINKNWASSNHTITVEVKDKGGLTATVTK